VSEGINNFVSVHKEKIFFYYKLYDSLILFANKYGIKNNLNPEDPPSIGHFIEKVLSDYKKLTVQMKKIYSKKSPEK
jgi:hypothetical protein